MKKRKRSVGKLLLTMGGLLLIECIPAQAAVVLGPGVEQSVQAGPGAANWVQDESGWHYQNPDGSYAQSQWVSYKGKWYYCDENGIMKTGKLIDNGIFYYLNEDGSMVSGTEQVIDGITYQFDDSGVGTAQWNYKQPLAIPPDSEKTEFHRQVDAAADAILGEIINDQMNQCQKATAIYKWVKGHMRYSGYSPIGDWVSGAWDGIRKHHGDCYTYYAMSAELLNRAGMRTIEVIRSSDNNHYWNLVEADGNWYHFDPCPRSTGGDFCLLTDAQIAYSSAHVFDHSLYPPTP